MDLVQEPHLRFQPWYVPNIPYVRLSPLPADAWNISCPSAARMHSHFHLRRTGSRYLIDSQEDVLQPKVRRVAVRFLLLRKLDLT